MPLDPGRRLIRVTLARALDGAVRSPSLLVAADYDGTLAPIVADPAAATPHRPAMEALVDLAGLAGVHTLIVSGRALDVLAALTGAPAGIQLIGSHGTETGGHAIDEPQARAVQEGLRAAAASFPGTVVEAKPRGGALHYRHASEPERAAAAARRIGTRLAARIIEGKKVVELLVGPGDKGTAVAQVRNRHAAGSVVFFGDDTTDEDVFATLGREDVGVKVGAGETLARFRVDDPAAVAAALSYLAEARRAAG